ncbi:hypothetical protein [Microbispora sp. H10949]|uniref:hypothetical protein n=1 Tax=Microbispora sp. H10949 TaxID=2729111 RepID=UPI0016043B67|nr:hypothetical protein [Microbispora sp. H10949]
MPQKRRRSISEADRLLAESESWLDHAETVKKAKTKRKADNAAEESKRLARMAENRAVLAAPGERGDGNFYISFVQMGQGDCAIMTTPAGNTLMVDCGSDATESDREPYDPKVDGTDRSAAKSKKYLERIRGVIHHPRHLGRARQLDYLIFTHPNTDHYNKIDDGLYTGTVTDEKTGVRINTYLGIGVLYHSDETAAYSLQIGSDNLTGWLLQRMDDNPSLTRKVLLMHTVTRPSAPKKGKAVKKTTPGVLAAGSLDADNFEVDSLESAAEEANLAGITETIVSTVNGDEVASAATPTVGRLDARGGYVIHTETDCTVTLLAAGVHYNYRNDPSDFTNRGSVITLVEVFGKKILICGDGTTSTEQYIRYERLERATESDRVKNLAILQVGHHGSVTSSHHKFVAGANAEFVVVSTGYRVEKDSLPKGRIISRHRNVQNAAGRTAKDHEIGMWVSGSGTHYFLTPLPTAKVPLYTTGTNGSLCFKIDKATRALVFLNEEKKDGGE